MGTRAIISVDDKLMIATHWDGYSDSLGMDLLECDKSLRNIINVAKKHSIDFADKSIREEVNKERIAMLVEKHGLTEEKIKDGVRIGSVISSDDYEIEDITHYGDWAEFQYNIKSEQIFYRPLRGSYPSSLEGAKPFELLTKEAILKEKEDDE